MCCLNYICSMIQQGAIVQCINDQGFPKSDYPDFKWPVKNEMYIVRKVELYEDGETALLLEEIKNPERLFFNNRMYEPHFKIFRFVLLQDPMCLVALLQEENILEITK
jgi:hypothetical protein